uniref:ARID domain-containing protein n=1 Tax=Cajanus cajan TaxID=3821 RepID=A0A151UCP9_CAJCA|nr:hypothetical protein KK1_021362 [Cajanus cajan]
MLGKRKHVNLYKLFLVVRGKGGYDTICSWRLWEQVGKELGLGVSVGVFVKLVYSNYLSVLDVWMKKFPKSKVAPEYGKGYENGGCPGSKMLDHEMNESTLKKIGEGNDAMEVEEEFDGGKMLVEEVMDVSNG